ncbi:hypothetical protein GF324_06480 [bacterium]|nr:hypothetical protein [bacterium]
MAQLRHEFRRLQGTWRQSERRQPFFESWTWTDSVGWRGVGYSIRKGDTIVYEVLTLTVTDSGYVYLADVEHNPRAVPYHVSSYDSTGFLAVNLRHDFPKRIHYKWNGADSLDVRIDDGSEDGEEGRSSRFRFHRETTTTKGGNK